MRDPREWLGWAGTQTQAPWPAPFSPANIALQQRKGNAQTASFDGIQMARPDDSGPRGTTAGCAGDALARRLPLAVSFYPPVIFSTCKYLLFDTTIC
jgi:hypothetical protein